MKRSEKIIQILKDNRDFFSRVVDVEFSEKNVCVLDFTDKNKELLEVDLDNIEEFTNYVFNKIKKEKKKVGVGGYLEDRLIYKRSKHFDNNGEPRCIHLGIDIWLEAGTEIFSPLPGIVHSYNNNSIFGDYGPTLILEHLIQGEKFYTLYGHLSEDSIADKEIGQQIRRGDVIAKMGDETVNGNWPPHVHFQVITNMLGKKGDFTGVAPPSAVDYYRDLCLDPNLILKISTL